MEIFSDKVSAGERSTKIPNSVIELATTAGDASAVILWMQLLKCSTIGKFNGQLQLADLCGRKLITWRRLLARLKELNLVEFDGKNIVLLTPSFTDGLPIIVTKETDIKPKRERTKTNKAPVEGYAQLINAWNKHKPPNYASLNCIDPKGIEAYNKQVKNLNHDINDFDGFIKIVCAGLINSDFWSDKNFKFYSVFGYGDPTDKKIRNVESLYNDGKRLFITPDPEISYEYDEKSILNRYNSWQASNYNGMPPKTNACVITPPVNYDKSIQDLFSTIRRYISLQAKTCVGMGQLDTKEIIGIELFLSRMDLDPCSYLFYYNEQYGWPTETRPSGPNQLETLDNDLWIFYLDEDEIFKTKPHMIYDVW